jgi:hypothetical protein
MYGLSCRLRLLVRGNMLVHGLRLRWFSHHCSARLLSGSVVSLLIAASALAGTKSSQPTTAVSADAAIPLSTLSPVNTKCQAADVKDQPIAVSQKTSDRKSAEAAPTITGSEVGDSPEAVKTEILQDKLWSTSLSRSSKDNELQRAPQCGMTTASQPPAE